MKFFHLSDLHIGLKLFNRDLDEDQRHVFGQICEAARREQPDAILIAGDIYDKAIPSAESVKLFDDFTAALMEAAPQARLMVISGNHDSGPRLDLFRDILQKQKLYMIGMPPRDPDEHIQKVTLEDEHGPVNFYLLPFVKPSMVKNIVGTDENGNNLSYDATLHALIERENVDQSLRNVLVSHQFYLPVGENAEDVERMDSEILTVGNIDSIRADVLESFDYAALGHIHKPMKVGNDRFRYCGTPLSCSVSEAGQQKGIILVELGEKGDVQTTVLPLTPLRQVKRIRGSLEEVLEQACGDFVSVVLTDKADLDVFDMQDRLRIAFPNLLEIRRENIRTVNYSADFAPETQKSPFDLCCDFLGDLDQAERAILEDVVNTAMEGQK